MSKGLILISGVNGYIAARTAKHFLDSGYSVRGTVRKLASAQPLLEDALKDYAEAGKFEVVEVPDITVSGAFDEAVKGVTGIAHMASPVSFFFKDPDPILHAAINGTRTMLDSALKAGSQLKTVVIISSIAAVKNQSQPPYTFTEKDWNDFAEAECERLGKETPGPIIYSASKVGAEKMFWKFRDEEKPGFTMTAINPVFVIGPPLLPPKTESAVSETIRSIWTVFSGGPLPVGVPGLTQTVDVRDVAALMLYPIEHPESTNGERYIASSAVGGAQAMADILREVFPDARGRIVEGTPGEGYKKDFTVDKEKITDINSSKAKTLLGGWTGYEKSVVDTAKTFAGLV
ncbi:NAD(P)-binding protein [Lindgomyces ingoldianus]|uniref:NAD(P)-binding protein n=1 Tax=Lindgomyces ingoldianus TaxID=673940 RepID=A0ACB6QKU0_9PLEO|nr:NAD(P)-binding protein [Lindgomyces ingoldianus]KAF2466761.1 NAD(P)-binding protein [Lindgomyces ingoldianus]